MLALVALILYMSTVVLYHTECSVDPSPGKCTTCVGRGAGVSWIIEERGLEAGIL